MKKRGFGGNEKSKAMLLRSIDKKGLLLWFIFSLFFIFILKWFFRYDTLFYLLVSFNVSTFLVMLIDKIQATQASRRLSERSLYLMTFLGGSVGMICAMYLLRHKSRKWSFQLLFSPSIPSF